MSKEKKYTPRMDHSALAERGKELHIISQTAMCLPGARHSSSVENLDFLEA